MMAQTKPRMRDALRDSRLADAAPVGSVGMLGGLNFPQAKERTNYLQSGLLGASMLPGVGDAAGLLSDAHMYATEPESRTPGNYALSALGALPMVPGAGMLRQVEGTLYRGGKAPNDGDFYSRDQEYAKGFDKGHFGQYQIKANKVMDFNTPINADDMAGTLAAMRAEGDNKAADMIEKVLREEEHAMGGHVYQWLKNLGKASPEYYLQRGGIDAIDTGRDIRTLNRAVAQPYSN